MSDSDVIREFLVKLGFKTDDASQRKFANGVAFATARVQLLVGVAEKAAEKLFNSVNMFVTGMEQLYFSAQRSGSSVTNIKSFELAAQGLGATAEEARGSIEGLAGFMRDIPGSEGFIASLGVKTHKANGELRDTTEILVDLGKKFQKMPWYLAKQYSSILGIDDNTLRALRSGEFEAGFRKAQDKFKNAGFDHAAEQAKQFKEKLRDVGAQFEILGVQIQSALIEKLGPKLDQFISWLEANGPQITAAIVRAVEILISAAEKLGPILSFLLDWFMKIDAATGGWSTTVLALVGILKLLGFSLTGTASGVAGLVSSVGALAAKVTAVTAVAYAGWELGSAIYEKALAGTETGDKIGAAIAQTLAFFGNKDAQEAIQLTDKANAARTSPQSNVNSVSQNTNIHVYGSEATTAGKSVANEQDRVNSRMVRNFKGAVQ